MGTIKGRAKCIPKDRDAIFLPFQSAWIKDESRIKLMETFGASAVPSPSDLTEAGRALQERYPGTTGSLGMAISEAVEDAATRDDTKYALGSVLNHVLLHQTVIGQEVQLQLEMAGVEPDVLVGCTGGGSNFAGFTFPFIGAGFRGGRKVRVVAAEPTAAPSLTLRAMPQR